MPEISVLVPAYNAEKTIGRTVQSILDQTFKDFELLVINDGSTDSTPAVVEAFNDNRVRVISKENGGIASARNFAIKNATGNYIAFLDADDWMENNTLELLYNKAKATDADMVVCDYRYVYEDGTTLDMHSSTYELTSLKEDPTLLIKIMPQPWNKLVKRSVFKKSDLSFPDGLVFEDLCFYSCLLPQVEKIVKLDEILINYYQLGTSIMASAKKIKPTVYNFNQVIQKIDDYYKANGLKQYHHQLEGLFALNARELIDGIFKNTAATKEEKIKVVTDILSTINQRYPKWYKNSYYVEKYQDFGKVYLIKRRIIDFLLSKNKIDLVVNKIVK